MPEIKQFKIDMAGKDIEDLQYRLKNTRWPDEIQNAGWDYGTNLSYLKDICQYWASEYDWRSEERKLNQFNHFRTSVDDFGIHFIHQKGNGKKTFPILLTHGFPDSFIRFLKIIPLLTAEDEQGVSFDLVIPSIPGFGFSDRASVPGMTPKKIASLFAGLMTQLGYTEYFAHGGDWGSSITEQLALNYPKAVKGIHMTDIPYRRIFSVDPAALSEEEKQFIQKGKQWAAEEGAYAMIQSTRPQTLAYGINDSPAGLAAWILNLFRSWCDCGDGELESRFTKDELLTNISIYWFTQTANAAFRLYYETLKAPASDTEKNVTVPTAAALFPKDLVPPPEAFAKRFYNLQQWTIIPEGGHFAAMEVPELLVADIRTFFKKLIP